MPQSNSSSPLKVLIIVTILVVLPVFLLCVCGVGAMFASRLSHQRAMENRIQNVQQQQRHFFNFIGRSSGDWPDVQQKLQLADLPRSTSDLRVFTSRSSEDSQTITVSFKMDFGDMHAWIQDSTTLLEKIDGGDDSKVRYHAGPLRSDDKPNEETSADLEINPASGEVQIFITTRYLQSERAP
ncbi:hypothetical protein JXA32_05605 [Candidatus Sumerlaeota bacterium]|nr:hypothetical protein [Candidatus Sumerlaeota bacterium]